jgi:D-amino-acid dehydrogenase
VADVDRDPACDEASFGNAGGLGVTEILPAATPGAIRQIPRWLVDPLGPLSIRPTYLPRLMPWLMLFLCSATRRRGGADHGCAGGPAGARL